MLHVTGVMVIINLCTNCVKERKIRGRSKSWFWKVWRGV